MACLWEGFVYNAAGIDLHPGPTGEGIVASLKDQLNDEAGAMRERQQR
jgi:hypothetical protein